MAERNQSTPEQGAASLMTVREIANVLSKSEQSVRRLMNEGCIPAVKVGNRLYCRRADFEVFLEACELEKEW